VGPDARTRTFLKALNAAGYLAVYQDDYAATRAYCERASALAAELNAEHDLADALRMLALVAWREADLDRAARLFKEAIATYRPVEDQQSIARSTISLANIFWMQARRDQALAGYEESLVLARAGGLKHEVAMALQGLGHAALMAGDLDVAGDLLRKASSSCASWATSRAGGDDHSCHPVGDIAMSEFGPRQ
jgi:tetratricopeptide (TPR) repeat protein